MEADSSLLLKEDLCTLHSSLLFISFLLSSASVLNAKSAMLAYRRRDKLRNTLTRKTRWYVDHNDYCITPCIMPLTLVIGLKFTSDEIQKI